MKVETKLSDELKAKLDAVRNREVPKRLVLPSPSVRRLARESCGLTQSDLGQLLGFSRQSIVLWESGRTVQPEGETRRAYYVVLVKLIKEALTSELARLEQANAVILEAETGPLKR